MNTPKLLIIEDDEIVSNTYRKKFSEEGWNVEVAADGVAGLVTIRRFRPDVVLLDLILPRLDGIEVMKGVRADAESNQLPIVVFSNTYMSGMIQKAREAGCAECLHKASASPREVINAVKKAAKASFVRSTGTPPQPEVLDAEFEAELLKYFLDSLPAGLAVMRRIMRRLTKAGDDTSRREAIHELYGRIHALTGNAAICGMTVIARMSEAIEALLNELHEKPANITPSTLRTVALSVDFLGTLFKEGACPDAQVFDEPRILVVDDELISRRTVSYALGKAKLHSKAVESGEAALKHLLSETYDLAILDIGLPGMDGLQLCRKLRALPGCKTLPVLFVTKLDDFKTRAKSAISGGNDFIAKPFLYMELAVRALLHVMRARLEAGKTRAD